MPKQVVLITGALSGIGRATAMAYAEDGARVVVSGRNDPKGAELAGELRAAGAEAEFYRREIADAILFVASDKASFFIGSSLSVDGGWTAV